MYVHHLLLQTHSNTSQSASYSSTAGSLGSSRNSVSYRYDSPTYTGLSSRPDSAASSTYAPTLKSSTMSPHSISGQYAVSDAPLSGSLPSISSEYNLSSYPDHTYLPHSGGGYTHHHRSGSANEYESPRHYKRPRANTSNATLYSQHEAASLLGEMSRSYSDHGSSTRLPSLAESYTLPSTEGRYASQEQATPGLSQSQMSGRTSYDFTNYIDANAGGGAAEEGQQEDVGREGGVVQEGS